MAGSGTGWPSRPASCRAWKVSIGHPFGAVGAGHDVDQVDAVVHLGDRRAADHVVQHGGDVLRGNAELAGAVLVDVDAQHHAGLVPVVDDAADMRVGADDFGEFQRQPAHGLDVRSAQPVLDRPADRRAEVERMDEAVDADELLAQELLQARRDAAGGRRSPWSRSPPGRRRDWRAARRAAGRSAPRPGRHRSSSARCRGRRPASSQAGPSRSLVSAIELVCGRVMSTSSSGRSAAGKNWFCT